MNGARVHRSYAFAFGTQPVPFQLPNGREISIKPTRVLIVDGRELEPLDPFITQCNVCATPMTASQSSCGDCGHTQESQSERRQYNAGSRRARRPLTVLSLVFALFAIIQFVQMWREVAAKDAASLVAAAHAKLIDADPQAQAALHDQRADQHAIACVVWSLHAAIMGLLNLFSKRAPMIGLSLGVAVFAYAMFNIVMNQQGLSLVVVLFVWPFVYSFVRGFAEARALRPRTSP